MNYQLEVKETKSMSLKTFLKREAFSRRLLHRVKDDIRVNGKARHLKDKIFLGDFIEIPLPDEQRHPNIVASNLPLNILYEDSHLLVVNKPAHLLSTVSWHEPDTSISNRVLGHYLNEQSEHKTIHLITRLDRDTSGVMLIAKHQLAHAKMDKMMQAGEIKKEYLAVTPPSLGILANHGMIDAPIGRSDHSIIEREVRQDGKPSLTEYWRIKRYPSGDIFNIRLHTGRTHQIRVHFQHVGLPLIGDDLYGGKDDGPLTRQALHCQRLSCRHPMTGEKMTFTAEWPDDIKNWIAQQA